MCYCTLFQFVTEQIYIYTNELKVEDVTDTQKPVSYLDLHLEIYNGGRLKAKLYDKCDDFTLQ
jgi:hypothetical protein